MKEPIKKELSRNFCLAIVIGIVAYLSKLVKKAAPVAACGLIVAMPLAGIGINVASDQEDDSSQYPVVDSIASAQGNNLDLPELPCIDHYSYPYYVFPYHTVEYNEHIKEVYNTPTSTYFVFAESSNVLKERDVYSVYIKALELAEESRSGYSVYNDEGLFKNYLDSIQSDAERGLKIGVKSLIPSPEGMVLDELTKGAYGKIFNINTIAQLGTIVQNMSETSAKMFEEMRKNPGVRKSISNDLNRRQREALDDAIIFYTIAGEDETVEKYKEKYKEMGKRKSILDVGKSILDVGIKFNPEVKSYVSRYGLTLPEKLDYVKVAITPQEKSELKEIKKKATDTWERSYNRYYINPGFNFVKGGDDRKAPHSTFITREDDIFLRDASYDLIQTSYWYHQFMIEDDHIFVPVPMVDKIKLFTAEGFKSYIDNMENNTEDKIKSHFSTTIGEIDKTIEEKNGPAVRRLAGKYYNQEKEYLEKMKKDLIALSYKEMAGDAYKIDHIIKEAENNNLYKIGNFIDNSLLGRGKGDKTELQPEEISVGRLGEDFKNKIFYFDNGIKEQINIAGYNGIFYCDEKDVVRDRGSAWLSSNYYDKIASKHLWRYPDFEELINKIEKRRYLFLPRKPVIFID